MTTVGFIGLGVMGAPMARNLVAAGFDVVGVNRGHAKAEAFARSGGEVTSTVAEAALRADVVALMLPDSPDVLGVVLGEDGVLTRLRTGGLLIDFSTVHPATARRIAEAGQRRGIGVLDAPVSGGEAAAVAGTLSIMVGGGGEHFTAARPVLDVVGGTVTHLGPNGAGQVVKAANQMIVAGTIGLVAEAVVFLEASGIDPRAAVGVLANGMAGSSVLRSKAESMIERQFQPGFRAWLHHKDLGIAAATARELAVATPLAALAAQLIGTLTAQGAGHLDHSALITVIEQLSGRNGNHEALSGHREGGAAG